MSSDASSFVVEGIIYGIPLVLLIFTIHEQNKAKEEKKKLFKGMLYSKENTAQGAVLDPSKSDNCVSYHNENCALSINNDDSKVTIITEKANFNYDFSNIVNVEIEVDGNSVASPSLGGAAIGGLLFGGAGAIVGSSYSTTKSKIKTIALKVFVDDLKVPFHKLLFYSSPAPMPSDHKEVCVAQTQVNEWYSRFFNIIEKGKNITVNMKTVANNQTISIADEITKLSDLLKDGAISKEEFEVLKKKLLGA